MTAMTEAEFATVLSRCGVTAAEAAKNYDDSRREMGWAPPLTTATPPEPRTLTARIAGKTVTYRVRHVRTTKEN